MAWVIAAAVVVLGLILWALWLLSRRGHRAPTTGAVGTGPATLQGFEHLLRAEPTWSPAAMRALSADVTAGWPDAYERLNPTGNPDVKALLDSFRNSGYQFNAHLGLKVLAAACEAVKPNDNETVLVGDVVREAIRQTETVYGR